MNDTERQPVETEEIVVNDTPVIVEQSVNDTITVKIPSDLSDEAKEELRKSIEEGNVSKLVAAWNRKNQLKNEEMAEIERIKGLKSDRIAQVLGHCPYQEVVNRDNLAKV